MTDAPSTPAEARARFLSRARSEAPGIVLPDEVLLAYAQARGDGQLPLSAALAQLHAGDLAVACAALRGDATAVAQVEAWCTLAARECALARGQEDDLRQAMTIDLLIRTERPARLEGYRGRGRLLNWLRTLAHTKSLNLLRGGAAAREVPHEALARSLETMVDFQTPELVNLKLQARDAFKQAFQAALASLEPKALNLLRLRCLEGASDTAVASFYKVSRSTVTRWFQDVRAELLARTKAVLTEQMSPSSVESLLRTLDGELEASMERFFDEHPAG
ncbi:MAG: hypothetical protein K1X89_20385 [Myxococcaceae bacterium]|nr:hypothetical protein [Myxococcaceae bacterium]